MPAAVGDCRGLRADVPSDKSIVSHAGRASATRRCRAVTRFREGEPMQSRTPRAPVASIDPLEARTLLAASIGLDGTLQVTGTDGPDAVVVRHGVNPNLIDIQVGPTTRFV